MRLLSKIRLLIQDCVSIGNPKIIHYYLLKNINNRIGPLILTQKKSYSLDRARKYWKYAPSSIGRVKISSEKLIQLSDVDLRRFVERSIQRRTIKQGADTYRDRVSSWIKKENVKNLLDFGCGLGQDGLHFAKTLGIEVTFADIVLANAKLVSRYSKIWGISSKAIYISCDPKEYEFPETYGLIFANGVLHHTPEAKEIILNLKRFLKPNGLFICMLYTRKSFEGTPARTLDEFAIVSEMVASLVNPYSDFYDVEKTKGIFEEFKLLETFQTYKGRFGWYVFKLN